MKLRLLAASLAAITTCALAAPIDEAKALLTKGNSKAASELLEQSLNQNLANADFNYVLGIALLDSGKPGEALFAFERVLAIEPGHALARAELARAMIALTEFDAAKIELQRARSGTIPADVTSKIDILLGELDAAILAKAQRNGAPSFSAYVEGEVGYDSNLTSSTSSSQIPIPALNNALFTPITAQSGTLLGINGGFAVQKRVGDGVDIYGTVDGRFRTYPDRANYTPTSLSLGAGVRLTRGVDQFSIGLSEFLGYTGATNNDDQLSIYGQWQRQFDRQNIGGVFVAFARANHPAFPTRNTNLSMLGTTWTHAYEAPGDPRLTLSAWAADDKERGNDPTVGRSFYGIKVAGEYQLKEQWKLFGSLTAQNSRYGGQNVFFLVKQEDARYDLNFGASYKPEKFWTYSGQITTSKNNSSIAAFTYARDQLVFTARREF